MQEVVVAAIQMAMPSWNREANIEAAQSHVRTAAAKGAQVVLLPELFELPYFCTEQDSAHFNHARTLEGNTTIGRFAQLAAELQVVLPISFFEQAGQAYFNTVALLDADGSMMGIYRKTHIPDGPGYNEKYYFTPGDTGYKVWNTRYARIGVGICWDQWFPECARSMGLMGAEMLLYPTAIGSEPKDLSLDSAQHWQTVMQGHAAANLMPLIAANRTGTEQGRDFSQRYFGSSFIAGPTGALVQQAGRDDERVLTATFDLDAIAQRRYSYGALATSDGVHRAAGA
jgi:N-carbamoylputrescine amidase